MSPHNNVKQNQMDVLKWP